MNREIRLQSLYSTHAGYVSDKWSLYVQEYERLFASLREAPVSLLEIGVQNGGSLEIWSKYFPNAECVVGCDINSACQKLIYDNSAIKVVVGDINQPETRAEIFEQASEYDIIIDDGSHTSEDIIHAFCSLFPHLKCGGIFIAEDLHCSYWKSFSGGLFHPHSSMAFFKALADIVNFQHWGLDGYTRRRLLRPFAISEELTEVLLAEIHSVEFVNSLCIIRRQPIEKNTLGVRIVKGETELVAPMKGANATECPTPPQTLLPTEKPLTLSADLSAMAAMLRNRLEDKSSLSNHSEQLKMLATAQEQLYAKLDSIDEKLSSLKDMMIDESK